MLGGVPARGTRAVASYDENAETMAVGAARLALRGTDVTPALLTFSTASPTHLDRTNATVVHAALRLDAATPAIDVNGSARSAAGALLLAIDGSQPTLVTAADVRTGNPNGPEEREGGDGGAALLIGSDDDGPVIAEVLATATRTEEFLDRWRVPGAAGSQRWEERFGETRYVPLAEETAAAALKAAELTIDDIDDLLVVGLHARAVKRATPKIAAGHDIARDPVTRAIGNTGAAHLLLQLTALLEQSAPGRTILVVHLADGADALVLRTTETIAAHRPSSPIATQVATGLPVAYGRYLSWRGHLVPEPPRRPAAARTSATAASRATDWKFGFVGSEDRSSGAIHMPPARVSMKGATVDDMVERPMADVLGTIATFTVDHVAASASPPTVFAVVDFDGGGRSALGLTDVDADAVAIGDRVEMTFRALNEADGIVNWFWKARPVAAAATEGDA